MEPGQKFCLKWNQFPGNLTSSLAAMRAAGALTDAVLVTEEGSRHLAHRVVMAAASTFFRQTPATISINRDIRYHDLAFLGLTKYTATLSLVGGNCVQQQSVNVTYVIIAAQHSDLLAALLSSFSLSRSSGQ